MNQDILSLLRSGVSAEDIAKQFADELNAALKTEAERKAAEEEAKRKAEEEKARQEVIEQQKDNLLAEIAAKAYEYAELAHPALAEAWGNSPVEDLVNDLRHSFELSANLLRLSDTLPNFDWDIFNKLGF